MPPTDGASMPTPNVTLERTAVKLGAGFTKAKEFQGVIVNMEQG